MKEGTSKHIPASRSERLFLISHGIISDYDEEFITGAEPDPQTPVLSAQQDQEQTETSEAQYPDVLYPVILDRCLESHHRYIHFSGSSSGLPFLLIQIGTQITKPLYFYGPAIRDHELIHLVLHGSGSAIIGGRQFAVHEGQLFYIPRNVSSLYQSSKDNPWEYAWIGFKGQWGQDALSRIGVNSDHPIGRIQDMAPVRHIIDAADLAIAASDPYLGLYGLACCLMDTLIRVCVPEPSDPVQDRMQRDNAADWINMAVIIIDHNYMKSSLTIQQIADTVGVSRTYLSSQFKKQMNITMKEYITKLRMEQAKVDMTCTNNKIKEVAYGVGYTDPLLFSKVFKKYYGVSPEQYRSTGHIRC